MDRKVVCNLAKTYCDELIRVRNVSDLLVQVHFSRHWFKCLLSRHSEKLNCFVARPVDQLQLQCFNYESLAVLFAQVSLVYNQYDIKCRGQLYNLDETWFSPGRDLCGTKGKRVVTSAGVTAVWARVKFQYTKRISVLLCFNMCGSINRVSCCIHGDSREQDQQRITRRKRERFDLPWMSCFFATRCRQF